MKKNIKESKVCVMGMGYVGLTLSVVLSEVGYSVWGIDTDLDVIKNLKKGEPHFFENGLHQRMKYQLKSGRLNFESRAPTKIFDVIIISVGTPLKKNTKIPNLNHLDNVLNDVGKLLSKNCLVCLRSTVPVGTTRSKVLPILEKHSGLKAGKDFYVTFAPERTVEGKALEELRSNPQVIGGITEEGTERAASFFHKVTPTIISVTSVEIAEFAKIMDNTYRDVCFSFANEMALISEHLKLDINEVIKASNIHYPRNNIPVPSPGVGGACLSKDPHILIDLSTKAGYEPNLIKEARKINEKFPEFIVNRLHKEVSAYNKHMNDMKVLIAGFAFKGSPETADLRDSTTIWLIKSIQNRFSSTLFGYDPIVDNKEIENLNVEPVNIDEAFDGINILIIANNHESFKKWDIHKILEKMSNPKIIYDGWRSLDKLTLKSYKDVKYLGPGI